MRWNMMGHLFLLLALSRCTNLNSTDAIVPSSAEALTVSQKNAALDTPLAQVKVPSGALATGNVLTVKNVAGLPQELTSFSTNLQLTKGYVDLTTATSITDHSQRIKSTTPMEMIFHLDPVAVGKVKQTDKIYVFILQKDPLAASQLLSLSKFYVPSENLSINLTGATPTISLQTNFAGAIFVPMALATTSIFPSDFLPSTGIIANTDTTISIPIHAPVSAAFTDTNPDTGKISGNVLISEPSDESDVTDFVVYWMSAAGAKIGSALTTVAPSGENGTVSVTLDAQDIPSGATELFVVSANSAGEMSYGSHVTLIDLGAPTHAAMSVSFVDTNTTGGVIQGDVSISKASDESDLTDYVLYWGSSATAKTADAAIATLPKTGGNLTYSFSTATPTGTTYLLVRTKYKDGEMTSGVSTQIIDKGVPVHAAVSASFTDTNTAGGIISGALTISHASDETDITYYALYWGDSSGAKLSATQLSDPIAKTGGDLTYTFTNATLPANATKILIKTLNADGEMAEGIYANIVDLGVPAHASPSLTFTDLDLDGGQLQGTVTITKAGDESDLTYYVLYWGSSSTTKMTAITAPIAKTGSNVTYTFSANTTIPTGATYLLARTKNADGEMATGSSLLIVDKGVPVHAAASVAFTDTDTTIGTLTGNIVVTKATDESDIVSYVLYWGSNTTTKQSNTPIATLTKTGSDVTQALSATAKPSGASHILVFTANADGEMATGVYVAITDLGVPLFAASSISFTDSDTTANELTGTLTIGAASDETNITHYVLYWGSNSTTKASSTPIATIAKSGSVTYAFSTTAVYGAPSSSATYFLVYTKNASGEMATPFSIAIVDAAITVSTFNYTGSNQTFTVPTGVTSLTVYAWGGGGGGGTGDSGAGGGAGFIQGTLSVTPGETLNVLVAGGGARGTSVSFSPGDGANNWAAGGGGRSALIRTSNSTELLTAAGGGGAANSGAGGAGGGTSGSNNPTNCATGGTQSAGGAGCTATIGTSGNPGTQFAGGSGSGGGAGGYGGGGTGYFNMDGTAGGGGGSGYYGGGAGAFTTGGNYTGGAGGSSHSDNGATSVTNTGGSGQTAGNTSNGYYVTGVGKGGDAPIGMSSPSPSKNGGNGLVVITY